MATKCVLAATFVLIGLLGPNSVRADTTYTYTGATFSSLSGLSCPPDCSVNGTFTIPAPLPPFTATFINPTAFDFQISTAGTPTWTNLNIGPYSFFELATDIYGNVAAWTFSLHNTNGDSVFVCNGPAPLPNTCGSPFDTFTSAGGGLAQTGGAGSLIATPEPSTLILLGTGLLGLAGAKRKLRLA